MAKPIETANLSRDVGTDSNSQPVLRRSPSDIIKTILCVEDISPADLRRSKLTLMSVLADPEARTPFRIVQLILSACIAIAYWTVIFPQVQSFGIDHWHAELGRGSFEPRPCGPFAEVSWGYVLLLSLAYVILSLVGVHYMERHPQVQSGIFEGLAIHNISQCLLHVYCLQGLLTEGRALGLGLWGNAVDTSSRSHVIGSYFWLQYHSRQLQLLDTAFMVVRKKFQGVSFLHVYLRVLNLWGWYIACRFACGGDAFFTALVSSTCQALVYGVYTFEALSRSRPSETTLRWAARIAKIQITQYIVCAIHSLLAAAFGRFPIVLAALHLFVIANGLILYTDFHSEAREQRTKTPNSDAASPRVTFSFDSCGWLMVYHFGVGAWLYEHLGLGTGLDGGEAPKGVAFSGSSGGALITCVLGAGVNPREVFEYILTFYSACHRNPTKMFPAVESALRKYGYPGAHKRLSGHVRVLLTRVTSRPPFVMGEVAEEFSDLETAIQTFCASCHIPIFAGLFPRCIGGRYYYDGLMWPSRLLVPWRGAKNDQVVRVSAASAPLSDIRIPVMPLWWGLFPPPPDILRGIYWCGYRDAARWFGTAPVAPSVDRCACRRATPSDAIGDDEENSNAISRWRAARSLLQRDTASTTHPQVDPATGEEVQVLIERVLAYADSQNRASSMIFVAVLVVLGAMLLATDTSLTRR